MSLSSATEGKTQAAGVRFWFIELPSGLIVADSASRCIELLKVDPVLEIV